MQQESIPLTEGWMGEGASVLGLSRRPISVWLSNDLPRWTAGNQYSEFTTTCYHGYKMINSLTWLESTIVLSPKWFAAIGALSDPHGAWNRNWNVTLESSGCLLNSSSRLKYNARSGVERSAFWQLLNTRVRAGSNMVFCMEETASLNGLVAHG